jgi:hypothetical protein
VRAELSQDLSDLCRLIGFLRFYAEEVLPKV